MTRSVGVAVGAVGAMLVVAGVLALRGTAQRSSVEPALVTSPSIVSSEPATASDQGFLYGRITAVDGTMYEGRLRWGRDQEAFWGDYFNGVKAENPWAVYASITQQSRQHSPIEIFGVEIGGRDRSLDRQFMARLGDVARIDARGEDVQVTLKSGTTSLLDRFEAGDIDDGVRVWDSRRGVVDLDARRVRSVEFLPTAALGRASDRLYGIVHTRTGDFTGYIQWNRQDCLGDDELNGRSAGRDVSVRYDAIRAIARQSRDSALVTRLDGRDLLLAGTRETGDGHLGIYVDDLRYGRVLVSWDAFERVEFSPRSSGPAYGDFPPGRALAGSVTTRAGRRLAGRLVYDFDESETTDTLDAGGEGVDYNIPFSLITMIAPDSGEAHGGQATVMLQGGDVLQLERTGDLGDRNAGLLIFASGGTQPDYVPWTDVERIDFDVKRSP